MDADMDAVGGIATQTKDGWIVLVPRVDNKNKNNNKNNMYGQDIEGTSSYMI